MAKPSPSSLVLASLGLCIAPHLAASNVINGVDATVAGGVDNTAEGDHSTVGGGQLNIAFADGSTVGGGIRNKATGELSSIAAGEKNTAGRKAGQDSACVQISIVIAGALAWGGILLWHACTSMKCAVLL